MCEIFDCAHVYAADTHTYIHVYADTYTEGYTTKER